MAILSTFSWALGLSSRQLISLWQKLQRVLSRLWQQHVVMAWQPVFAGSWPSLTSEDRGKELVMAVDKVNVLIECYWCIRTRLMLAGKLCLFWRLLWQVLTVSGQPIAWPLCHASLIVIVCRMAAPASWMPVEKGRWKWWSICMRLGARSCWWRRARWVVWTECCKCQCWSVGADPVTWNTQGSNLGAQGKRRGLTNLASTTGFVPTGLVRCLLESERPWTDIPGFLSNPWISEKYLETYKLMEHVIRCLLESERP